MAREPEVALANVAYIPQIAPPADAPTREVVRAAAALRRVSVARVGARAERLGLDLDACGATRFRDLSGGTKQKLLAALALAAEAEVLLCDEPTANRDAQARAAFFAEVDARPASHVLVLCSHRVEEVRQLVRRSLSLVCAYVGLGFWMSVPATNGMVYVVDAVLLPPEKPPEK